MLMERLQLFDKAEEAYLRTLALDPQCTSALLSYANLLVDIRSDHASAESYYKRAIRAARLDVMMQTLWHSPDARLQKFTALIRSF